MIGLYNILFGWLLRLSRFYAARDVLRLQRDVPKRWLRLLQRIQLLPHEIDTR